MSSLPCSLRKKRYRRANRKDSENRDRHMRKQLLLSKSTCEISTGDNPKMNHQHTGGTYFWEENIF
jgi:hypothetical protein